mmetsp:Transcript_27885/g.88722  ORF Transcript_27885/g.88722 Transcript_27885/m.88722 type:complete len:209 (-) Transcript_27885:2186-2812(-)
MGVGDALSSKSEMEAALKEKDREGWEYDNYLEGEIKEMVEIYEAKGVSREDARLVITTLAKYKDVFVDLMLKDELGLDVPDEDDNPWVDGMVTFGAFVCFGFIPLVAYIALAPLALDSHVLFLVACVLTAVTLFALGAIKSSVTERSWLMSGSETLSLGKLSEPFQQRTHPQSHHHHRQTHPLPSPIQVALWRPSPTSSAGPLKARCR